MNLVDQIRQLIQTCSDYLGPNPWLQALTITTVSLVIAYIATTFLRTVIGRFTRFSKTELDDKLVKMLNRPIFLTLFLIGLTLAVGRLEIEASTQDRIVSILKSIGVWVWMMFGLRFTRLFLKLLESIRDRLQFVDARTLPLLQNAAFMVVILGSIYALMNAWHIDVTALVASAGILGLALSFAAKDTLANVFAGVSILADSPYKIGDFVVLGSGERGEVTQIGIRSTRLLTRDDVEITIPNAVIGNAKIINESGGPYEKYRIRSKISVAYDSDLDSVCKTLKEIATNHDGVCDSPTPRVRVRGFGDHGITIELLSWVATPVQRGKVSHELYMKIFESFNQLGIEIPFPQQDVRVRSVADQAKLTGAND